MPPKGEGTSFKEESNLGGKQHEQIHALEKSLMEGRMN